VEREEESDGPSRRMMCCNLASVERVLDQLGILKHFLHSRRILISHWMRKKVEDFSHTTWKALFGFVKLAYFWTGVQSLFTLVTNSLTNCRLVKLMLLNAV